MNDQALILTKQQADALKAANDSSNTPNRRIEPRLLEDGTYILNADILDDPTFADATKGWRAILNQIPRPTAQSKTLEELDATDLAAKAAKQIGEAEAQP